MDDRLISSELSRRFDGHCASKDLKADDLISVVVVATLFHLVPAVTVNLALFVLMTLIDSWRNHG
jgi:hypothetical protein